VQPSTSSTGTKIARSASFNSFNTVASPFSALSTTSSSTSSNPSTGNIKNLKKQETPIVLNPSSFNSPPPHALGFETPFRNDDQVFNSKTINLRLQKVVATLRNASVLEQSKVVEEGSKATIEMKIGCKNLIIPELKKPDKKKNKKEAPVATYSHALVLVHEKDPNPKIKGLEWKLVGKTEHKPKLPDPMFDTPISIPFRNGFEVKLTVYDADGRGYFQDAIGSVHVPLVSLLNFSGDASYPLQANSQERTVVLLENQCSLHIYASVNKDLSELHNPSEELSPLSDYDFSKLVERLEGLAEETVKSITKHKTDAKMLRDAYREKDYELQTLKKEAEARENSLQMQLKQLNRHREEYLVKEKEYTGIIDELMKKEKGGGGGMKNVSMSLTTSTMMTSGCPQCKAKELQIESLKQEVESNGQFCRTCRLEIVD